MAQPIRVLQLLDADCNCDILYQFREYAGRMDPRYVCFDFLVYGTVPEWFQTEMEQYSGRVYQLAHTCKGVRNRKKRIKEFLRSHEEYQILHAHAEEESVFAMEAGAELGIPIRICHAHGELRGREHRIHGASIATRLCRASTYLFADCVADAERLFGISELERVIVFPQFVDLNALRWSPERRLRARERLEISPQTFAVGCTDPALSWQDMKKLLIIFRCLCRKYSDSRLILAPEHNRFARQLCRKQYRKLPVLVSESREQLEQDYMAMDACLFPGVLRRIPYDFIQAQVAGIPCVISESIPKEGILLPTVCSLSSHKTAEKWVEILLHSATQRKKISCPRWVEQYDVSKSAQWLEKLYWEEYYSFAVRQREREEELVKTG